jgi:hypothetical protein
VEPAVAVYFVSLARDSAPPTGGTPPGERP